MVALTTTAAICSWVSHGRDCWATGRRGELHFVEHRTTVHCRQGGLGADAQLALFNDLKEVEALLRKADADDRMVCERVALAGTRRYQMACMTRAERDRKAESARKAMMDRAACTTQECMAGGK